MNIRNIPEGESLIPAIERDFPELLGWSKGKSTTFDLNESQFQQCDVCSKINLDDAARYRMGPDGISRGPEHRKSWVELKASAIAGCHVCKLIHFARTESDKQARSHQRGSPDAQVYIHRWGTMLEVSTSITDRVSFRLSTSKDCPRGRRNEEFNSVTSRLVEDDPASTEAFARAQSWIDFCKTNHPYCIPNEDVPLPTRVLDVQASTGTGDVSLFITSGKRSKYTALSHCWGGTSVINGKIIRTCTAETYEELKTGFSISRLPMTFQDAILVTRKLGIRYLWIDSLCIKQDSREDWSVESALMSKVYGNSFLTILATTAQNSDQGFLSLRDPHRCIKTKFCPIPNIPEHWIWIRWPPSEGRWDYSDRKIMSRAWAFQEYSLPPRLLDYAPTEMEWHCNQASFEERSIGFEKGGQHDTYKELMWILSLPDITKPPGTEKIVPTHPKFAGSPFNLNIYERWYTLVEGYSTRNLTIEADRLPAIAGLARKIQEISGDIYMAGLWKNDLGNGLCWKFHGFGDFREPLKYIAPSWSWASLQGSITHSTSERHRLSAELLDFEIKTDENNALGEVFSGSITLIGPVRRLRIVQGTVRADHTVLDHEVNHWKRRLESDGEQKKHALNHQYALKDQEDVINPRGTGICSICFDIGAPPDSEAVVLLQLLAEGFAPVPKGYDDEFVAHGIVLKKVVKEDVYRRIGVYSVVDAEAGFITPGSKHSALRGWNTSTVTII